MLHTGDTGAPGAQIPLCPVSRCHSALCPLSSQWNGSQDTQFVRNVYASCPNITKMFGITSKTNSNCYIAEQIILIAYHSQTCSDHLGINLAASYRIVKKKLCNPFHPTHLQSTETPGVERKLGLGHPYYSSIDCLLLKAISDLWLSKHCPAVTLQSCLCFFSIKKYAETLGKS